MAQTNVNIRIDENLKKEFEELCQELGLSMTAAFTVFAKTAVRRQGIPFEISREVPNARLRESFDEADRIIRDPSKSKGHTDIEELKRELVPKTGFEPVNSYENGS